MSGTGLHSFSGYSNEYIYSDEVTSDLVLMLFDIRSMGVSK